MLKPKTVQVSVSLSFKNNIAQKLLQIVKRAIFYIKKSETVQLHFRIPVFLVQFLLRKV